MMLGIQVSEMVKEYHWRNCCERCSLEIRSAPDAVGSVGIVDYAVDSMDQPHAAGNRDTHHLPSNRRTQ